MAWFAAWFAGVGPAEGGAGAVVPSERSTGAAAEGLPGAGAGFGGLPAAAFGASDIGAGAGAEAEAGAPGTVAGVLAGTTGAGVTVVVMAWVVWPGWSGWTVVVVVLPFLSVVTICWGWPVALACCSAFLSAASCLEVQPASARVRMSATAAVVRGFGKWDLGKRMEAR
jgi:hypothetical protein